MRADKLTASESDHPDWEKLLVDAVEQPGIISEAYSRFWSFSTGNQILALIQCLVRNIAPGPIHTFKGWRDVGRHVRKGEKAISLVMPITIKRKRERTDLDSATVRSGDGAERQITGSTKHASNDDSTVAATVFAYKPHWFVLSQTDGEEYIPPPIPQWTEAAALHALGIDRTPFAHPNGNCQGYAEKRSVAVSTIAILPHKTLFHEIAHVVLGHTEEGLRLDDHELTPRNVREVEAESVAYICCQSLNLSGAAECRGYIQHWLAGQKISERSAQRIFKAADQILKAGQTVTRSDDPLP